MQRMPECMRGRCHRQAGMAKKERKHIFLTSLRGEFLQNQIRYCRPIQEKKPPKCPEPCQVFQNQRRLPKANRPPSTAQGLFHSGSSPCTTSSPHQRESLSCSSVWSDLHSRNEEYSVVTQKRQPKLIQLTTEELSRKGLPLALVTRQSKLVGVLALLPGTLRSKC